MSITLPQAQTIVSAALRFPREKKFSPMGVVVLDARGVLKAYGAEDGTALRRYDIALGKAYGALAMGVGSRTLGMRAVERPHFIAAVTTPSAARWSRSRAACWSRRWRDRRLRRRDRR